MAFCLGFFVCACDVEKKEIFLVLIQKTETRATDERDFVKSVERERDKI